MFLNTEINLIRFNLKIALRSLHKNRVYSLLIIGGYAIGFATCILIGLYYQTEKSVNKDFANHKQIYRLYDKQKNRCNINYDLLVHLKEDFPEVVDACPLDYSHGYEFTLKNDETNANIRVDNILSSTNSFFNLFSVNVVSSLSHKPFEGLESIALNERVAKVLFGTKDPLGQTVNINNFFTGIVSAIFKGLPANSSFQAEIIMNSANPNFRQSSTISNGMRYNPTNHFVLIKEHTNTEELKAKMNGTIGTLKLDVDSIGMQNLADIYLSPLTMKSSHIKGNAKLLKIFLAIAFLIILLSSINYLNYSISVQYNKLREIGINKTNGANWYHMVRYTLTEVTLGISIASIISILISYAMMPFTAHLFGKALSVSFADFLALSPIFAGILLTAVILNSFAPIYLMSKFKITEFLSGFGKNQNRKQLGKQLLLTFQLTTSIVLIVVVMIIFKQLSFVKNSDLGFDSERLLKINLPHKFKNTEAFKQEIEKLTFIKKSALSSGGPGMITTRLGSNTGDNSFTINCIQVGDSYLETMGIKLLVGREFHKGDIDKVCVLNHEAIKQFNWENIEGKTFNNGKEGGYSVVGMIDNFNVKSFHSKIEPLALIYTNKVGYDILSIKLISGNLSLYMDQIKQVWKTFSPHEPLSYSFYNDQFQAMYNKEEKLAKSITFFSLIAIALTCMGLLGQIFMICLNRIKEIGIRKVNGAKVSELLRMLNEDFFKWFSIAFVIACPIAWSTMQKWLENFAYKTELSWWIFVLAGIITIVISMLTVSVQSWKAASRNPVEALRYE